jgi:hypothetical protein
MSELSNSSDASQFRADREIVNDNISNKQLEAIKDLPASTPTRKPLDEAEAKAATQALFRKEYTTLEFPRNMKTRVDPKIPHQNWGLLSFIPAKNAVPDKEGCYGIVKFRGAFDSIREAEEYGQYIITEIDSYSEVSIVHIGYEFPLLQDDEMYTAVTREIDVRQKCDDTYKANFKKKRDAENKDMKEIQERREKLLDTSHSAEKEKAIEDIDLYLELRVKKANAMMALDEGQKAIEKASEIIRKTKVVLDKIENEHPDYKDEYLERYTRALSAVGTNPYQNPLIEYMKKDDANNDITNTFEEIKITPVEEKKE